MPVAACPPACYSLLFNPHSEICNPQWFCPRSPPQAGIWHSSFVIRHWPCEHALPFGSRLKGPLPFAVTQLPPFSAFSAYSAFKAVAVCRSIRNPQSAIGFTPVPRRRRAFGICHSAFGIRPCNYALPSGSRLKGPLAVAVLAVTRIDAVLSVLGVLCVQSRSHPADC